MTLFIIFFSTLVISLVMTLLTIKIAKKFDVLDRPDENKKRHIGAIPLLGGLGIFFSFFLVISVFHENILSGNLTIYNWAGVFFGAIFIVVGGILDDKFNLGPSRQIIFPVLAVIAVLLGGVQIEKITNPFGGFLMIGGFKVFSSVIIALWLLGMMYTTKLLDGLDGLVTGVTSIGAFIIFLFTMTEKYYQPDIGFAALVLFAACLGFLILNWHPAKIFLGEGGSLLLGFLLGVLAIISGGKIAIALLVMGLPIMDVVWVVIRRLKEGKNPFRFADRKHLHHRLLDLGFGVKRTVLIFYGFSLVFGLSAVFLQSKGKLYALGMLVLVMFFLVMFLNKKSAKFN